MSQRNRPKFATYGSQSLDRLTKRSDNQKAKNSIRTMTQMNPEVLRLEQALTQLGITSQFLSTLFEKRCEENQIRPEEDKYRIFTKQFFGRVQRTFSVSELRLKESSLVYFLKGITNNPNIIGLDLSFIKLVSIDPVLDFISSSDSLCKLHMGNMSLQPKDFSQILQRVTKKEQLIHLDLSNRGFEGINRLGQNYCALSKFIESNKILQILQLQGLSIKDRGLQALAEGFKGKSSSIVSLNLRNNGFSRNGYSYIKQIITQSCLKTLDLSENKLCNHNINQLSALRLSQISQLNLSNTDMESEGLSNLLGLLRDNKCLSRLSLNNNNFSHNWFKRIEESVAANRSLRVVSLNNCKIKYHDSLFRALYQNHVLEKLDLSNNELGDTIVELVELLKRNSTLKELKLKSCGLEPDKCLDIFATLTRNMSLKTLDIAENSVGVEAGRQLLKVVLINTHLTSINLEKTQVEVQVKISIDVRLQTNRIQYNRHKRMELRKENQMLKTRQKTKIDNLPQLRFKAVSNKQLISQLKAQVGALNSTLETRKDSLKMDSNKIQVNMSALNKELIKIQVDYRPLCKQLEHQQQHLDSQIKQLTSLKHKELDVISRLQSQLVTQKQRIRELENKLEKQLQNQKYLNRKTFSLPKLPQAAHTSELVKHTKTSYRKIKTISKIDVRQRG